MGTSLCGFRSGPRWPGLRPTGWPGGCAAGHTAPRPAGAGHGTRPQGGHGKARPHAAPGRRRPDGGTRSAAGAEGGVGERAPVAGPTAVGVSGARSRCPHAGDREALPAPTQPRRQAPARRSRRRLRCKARVRRHPLVFGPGPVSTRGNTFETPPVPALVVPPNLGIPSRSTTFYGTGLSAVAARTRQCATRSARNERRAPQVLVPAPLR